MSNPLNVAASGIRLTAAPGGVMLKAWQDASPVLVFGLANIFIRPVTVRPEPA
jgi:hypothetical protein